MPSENVAGSTDRRTRKREQRRAHLLDLALDIVEADGIEGLTMAALAEAADYAPASLYTYFASRGALLASLQSEALHVLERVAVDAVATWDEAIATADVAPGIGALARLRSFAELFLTAPDHHPREFRLQQRLLVAEGEQDADDAVSVVPAAMGVLLVPRQLLVDAVAAGALAEPAEIVDPLGQPVDGALLRTISWVVAMNGALLTDGLVTGLPTTGAVIGRELTDALLLGWGAAPNELAAARSLHLGGDD